MPKRRSSDGFNLAFLDVMACGLGAIILILMLVKFKATTEVPNDELERLQQELAALESQRAGLQEDAVAVDKTIAAENLSLAQLKQRIQQLSQQQRSQQQAIKEQQAVLANVEKSAAAVAPRQAEDTISLKGVGEENYLLGLKVEGRHIGILIDNSASMTDERLINIIRRKISSDQVKKTSPKWRRTKRVVKWLLARLPRTSKVSIISFNDTARSLGPRTGVAVSNKQKMNQLVSGVEQLVPRNGTNLQNALKEVQKLRPKITNLYVVTDGLPTLGKAPKSLSSLARCSSLFGKSKTISGECRLRLFIYSVQQAKLSGVKVNVILLPLEGDPQAPQAYWDWSASTGGLMLSPAGSWP